MLLIFSVEFVMFHSSPWFKGYTTQQFSSLNVRVNSRLDASYRLGEWAGLGLR